MKHTYSISVLTAAAALSLLAFASSCAKISIDKPDQAEQYIDFATDVETKAPVESVWAYRSDDALSLPEVAMNGINVYRSGSVWAYDNVQMWVDGIWHFEAMYPDPNTLGQALIGVDFYIPKSEGQAEMDGVSISYFDGTKADVDLMLAKADRTYSSAAPDARAVSLKFEHLLSRVSIAVKAVSENVTLSSLTFADMSVLGEYNTTTSGTDKWHLLTDVGALSNVPTGSFSADMSEIENPLPSDGTSVPVLSDLLLIPQTPGDDANGLDPITITATYSVGGAAPETKELTLPADPAWQPGRHYRYTLTLAGADVTLSVETVPWEKRDFTVIF